MLRYAHKIKERPTYFRINPECPLYIGLLAAYLGYGLAEGPYHDSSRNQYHGVYTNFAGIGNTPTQRWGRGLGRGCLAFIGTDDTLPPSAFNGLDVGNWTIACWFNSFGEVQYGGIVQLFQAGLVQTKSSKFGILRGANTVSVCQVSAASVTTGVWTSVIGMASGAQTGGGVAADSNSNIYINGVNNNGSFQADVGYGTATKIGTQYAACNAWMSDVMVWNRTLNATEILAVADRSNAMLEVGGVPLVLPMRRRGYTPQPASGAKLPPGLFASGVAI